MIQAEWTRGVRKEIQITVDGAAVSDEITALTYTDDINGDSGGVRLGSACAAAVEFTVAEPSVSYAGAVLEISIAGVPLGSFTVIGARMQDGRLAVTAADAMAGGAMQEYFEPSAASGTALGVIREIAAGAGLSLADVSGISDVSVTGLSVGCTRREMLGRIAAVLGRNAHIDRYGKLCLRWYENNGGAIGPGDIYAGGIGKAEADYEIEKIECSVTTVTETTEDDTTTEQTQTVVLEAGMGSMGISLDCPYMTQAILDGIYTRIEGFAYRPMTLTIYGDCRIETGDILTVTDPDNAVYTVPVMAVTHAWDGGVKTIVKAAGEIAAEGNGQLRGTLGQAVARLEAELARFRNLEAENITVLRGRISQLFADWAHIGEAVIETIMATGINTDWLISNEVTASEINLTEQSTIQIPDERNPSTLLPNQYISGGWIRPVSPNLNYVCYGGTNDMSYMKEKSITITCECLGSPPSSLRVVKRYYFPCGGAVAGIGDDGWEKTSDPVHIPEADYKDNGQDIYIYTYHETFGSTSQRGDTVIRYTEYSLEMDVPIRRVKITMSDGTAVSLSGRGLEIGDFTVDRDGVPKYDGSRLLAEDTGVKKSGDTMTGNLIINGSTDVGAELAKSLSFRRVLTASDDLDDIKEPGMYYIATAQPANMPAALNYCSLFVWQASGIVASACQSIMSGAGLQYEFRRRLYGNPATWRDWTLVFYDSGWKTLTYNSAFRSYNADTAVRYRRIGNVVEIVGVVQPTAEIAAGGSGIIGTLPAGYCPAYEVHQMCHGSSQNLWLLNVRPSRAATNPRAIGFARYGTNTTAAAGTNVWLPLHITYFTDDAVPT